MEHIELICSLDSKLHFCCICPIRIPAANSQPICKEAKSIKINKIEAEQSPTEFVAENDDKLKNEPKKQNTPKRHSSTKKRQQRIERRIAKGKPFKRIESPGETPPKPLIERLTKDVNFAISDDKKKITLT